MSWCNCVAVNVLTNDLMKSECAGGEAVEVAAACNTLSL
jgi:hypothetical protein